MKLNNNDTLITFDTHTDASLLNFDRKISWLCNLSSFFSKNFIVPAIVFFLLLFCKTSKANATSQHFPNGTHTPKPNVLPACANPSPNIASMKRVSLTGVSASSYSQKLFLQNKPDRYLFKKDSFRRESNPQNWVDLSIPRLPFSQDLAVHAFDPSKLPATIQFVSSQAVGTFLSPISEVFTRHFMKDSPEMTEAKINKIKAETLQILDQNRRDEESHRLEHEHQKKLNIIDLLERTNKASFKTKKRNLHLQTLQKQIDPVAYEKSKTNVKSDENVAKTIAFSDEKIKDKISKMANATHELSKNTAERTKALLDEERERKTALIEVQLARLKKSKNK
nr:hypothetical protein [Interfilum sp. SAG 36.88]